MTSVVVAVDGEVTMRAAHSLSSHPGISTVTLLAPSTSSHFDTVDSVEGHDVVMGASRAAHLGATHGVPAVVTHHDSQTPGTYGASPTGLVLALAVGVEGVDTMAVAEPGEPDGDISVVFPSPIDGRAATVETVDGHPIHVAPGPGPLGAVMVTGARHHRAIIDDHRFLAGIALAAGVALIDPAIAQPVPVWTRAENYLRAAVDMGLVIGERSAV